jgi:[ribosomal protein S5]-alanine N-acetyltransferase
MSLAIERLRAGHAPALLAFERENRAYFAASISDRGDAFFEEFDELLALRLAEQDEGICHFHVLVEAGGAIVGRVNLIDVTDGSAELGYRIAERVAGRGVATAAVRDVCALAAVEYGLSALTARTTLDNVASQTVLARTGFVVTGETVITGKPGLQYVRELRPSG